MVRAKRTLTVVLSLAIASVPGIADAGPGRSWFPPSISSAKTYPVLLSSENRWLNFKDTYGAPRMRFENGVWRQTGTHQGIDIFAEQGTPIVSITPGVIENSGWTFYSGYRVGVRADDGRYYFYAHMLPGTSPGIVQGARVSAGTEIGRMGSSGYGPEGTSDEFPAHLHFGLQQGSRWLNPNEMLTDLYRRQSDSVEGSSSKVLHLKALKRVLASRLSAPGAPAPALISARLGAIDAELSALQARRVT